MNQFKETKHYILKEIKPFWKRNYWLTKAYFRNVFLRNSQIPYLEVFVTTKCNLSCEKCSNLVPQLKKQLHYPANDIISNIESILRYAKYIYRLKLHGGEVFLHPDLSKLIDYVSGNKRIISTRITTNGTLIPNESILQSLSGSRIVVQISEYEISSGNIPKLIQLFNDRHIKYVLLKDREWRDMGDFSERGSNRFFECSIKRCTSLFGEDVYVCSRAAMALQEHEISDSYHININGQTSKEFKSSLRRLYTIPNEACSHCDGDTKYAKPIPAGKQVLK